MVKIPDTDPESAAKGYVSSGFYTEDQLEEIKYDKIMKYLKIFEEYYSDKIEELKKYEGERLFPLGKIYKVSYSNLGQTLLLRLTGDVPTNFSEVELVIVHPDSYNGGWIGIGNIGLNLQGSGAPIEYITLPEDTVELIKTIYQEYTDKPCEIRFKTGVNITKGKDATQFAKPGFYKNEIENYKNINKNIKI